VQSKLEWFFMRAFNQILNIDTQVLGVGGWGLGVGGWGLGFRMLSMHAQTDFAFTRHGFSPDNMIGSAGLYVGVVVVVMMMTTTLISNTFHRSPNCFC